MGAQGCRRLPRGSLNDGLHPVPEAARISFSGNKLVVTDGPFSEAKEVVGGLRIIEVKSKEEVIQWADLAHS